MNKYRGKSWKRRRPRLVYHPIPKVATLTILVVLAVFCIELIFWLGAFALWFFMQITT
jgi:hypothetical protein